MRKIFLGIDTSNYMTSICYIDENRQVIYEGKKLLEVKDGDKGLRQSDALFQHIKNLPILFKEAGNISNYALSAVAVSKKPRPVKDSYMPVFLAGISTAECIAYPSNVPLIHTTHQEGHIAAGLYSIDSTIFGDNFLAVHLSGGTSEFLQVEKKNFSYNIKKIGGTLDLHAGQLVDRVGVMLGLPFPSGAHIEELAKEFSGKISPLSTSIRDYSFNLSGAESQIKEKIATGTDNAQIARSVEHVIAESIAKVLKKLLNDGYSKDILIVGGVAQNQYIRNYLITQLERKNNEIKLHFAKKKYSGDNAFGVANVAVNYFLNSIN